MEPTFGRGKTTVSVPTRLLADWSDDSQRSAYAAGSPSGPSRQWSSLRGGGDSQQLTERARSYILSMLHQDPGPRYPGQ